MNIKPIPNELLGDSFTLLVPSAAGKWTETAIRNVRVERTETITEYSSQKQRDNTEITVWFDYANSSPKTDFSVGMKVRCRGEIFVITEQKVYSADNPHHCRFKARKIGGEYTG